MHNRGIPQHKFCTIMVKQRICLSRSNLPMIVRFPPGNVIPNGNIFPFPIGNAGAVGRAAFRSGNGDETTGGRMNGT